MEQIEYVHTIGMDESELVDRLRSAEHGVLGLADGGDAYAVPLSFHFDDGRILLRVSDHDRDAEKRRYIETTETATLVCFDASTAESWSILVRGPLRRWREDVDEVTLNEWFPPFRVFDEAIGDIDFLLYELAM